MKIAFWLTSTTRHMTAENWGKAPMGGAEISAVNLGEELIKQGCDVTYFLQRAEPFDKDQLHIRRHSEVFDSDLEYFICVRPHPVLGQRMDGIRKILWSGDAFDQTSNEIFWNKDLTRSMDAFVFKSEWQREKILEKYFYIEPEKARVIYNGIKAESFSDLERIKPIRGRFIHASTWYRGVKNFAYIWPRIIERLPEAELHVFSKTSLYSEFNPKDDGWLPIAEELAQIPGIILREPVPQSILIREIRKAWLMLYPNSGFVESSCGVALQALGAGTPVITTARAGLPEAVQSDGVLVSPENGWQNEFVEETCKLALNEEKRNVMGETARLRVLKETWQRKATEWLDFLKSLSAYSVAV